MSYRWANAFEWLDWATEVRTSNSLSGITTADLLNFIKANCDSDDIQDYFQEDMDQDGFFANTWDENKQEFIDPLEGNGEGDDEEPSF